RLRTSAPRDALPIYPQLERGDGAVRQPRLHRAGNRTGDLAPPPYGRHGRGVASGDVPPEDVTVPGELLGAAGHREVGAELQRARSEEHTSELQSPEN